MLGKFDEEVGESPPPEEEEAPLPAQFSEDNLARHWVLRHGKDWRYIAQWGAWFKWSHDHWQQEKTIEAFELARNITREALSWEGITKSERLRVNSAKTAGAMLQFVKSDRKIATVPEIWDTNPMLLGVPGGVLDLKICKNIQLNISLRFLWHDTVSSHTSQHNNY